MDVWPEHRDVLRIFMSMSTQWRIGMAGPTGLDYGPMFAIMDRASLTDDQWHELFDDLRVMEAEAMKVMRDRNDG